MRGGTPADVLVAAAAESGSSVVWAQREYSPSAMREQDSVQASLAWMRRKVKAAQTLMGWDHRDDSMVALTVSIKPRR